MRRTAAHAALPDATCHRPPAGPAAGADANLVRTAIEQISLAVLPLAERCMGAEDCSSPDPSSSCTVTHYMRQSAPNFVLADVWRFVLESNDLYWGSYFFDLLGVVS